VEEAICRLRPTRKLGPRQIAAILGLAASPVYAVLRRHGLHRLTTFDRPSDTVIRRYERPRPGELVHIDVKKPGRIPDGGGWRMGSKALADQLCPLRRVSASKFGSSRRECRRRLKLTPTRIRRGTRPSKGGSTLSRR
jgi:hypothetical protein